MYAIFFATQVPAIQVAVPQEELYKKKVPRKLNKCFRKRNPKTGLANVRLLHDNASSHKTYIVRDILKQKKVVVLAHPLYSPI
jgi:hypothetical protein